MLDWIDVFIKDTVDVLPFINSIYRVGDRIDTALEYIRKYGGIDPGLVSGTQIDGDMRPFLSGVITDIISKSDVTLR
jgi:hypothetical protein